MTDRAGMIAIFDAVAEAYDSVDVDFFTPMGAELVRRAGITPGESILDVGCGRGAVLFPAARATGPSGRVTGIDFAPAMVALTAAATTGMPGVTVLVGEAQDPAFPPASFDVVTAGIVLSFLPDPLAALAAYRRILRPGGRLAMSSFAAYDPRYVRAMGTLARHAVDPPPRPARHELFRDGRTLHDGLTGQGYTDVDVGEYEVRSRFRDTAHFVEWVDSHAGRQILRKIPAPRRRTAFRELAEVLGPPDQPLTFTTKIHIAVARS